MCLHSLCCFTMLLELRHHFAFFGFAAVAALSGNALRAIFRTHLHDAGFNTQFSKIHTVAVGASNRQLYLGIQASIPVLKKLAVQLACMYA